MQEGAFSVQIFIMTHLSIQNKILIVLSVANFGSFLTIPHASNKSSDVETIFSDIVANKSLTRATYEVYNDTDFATICFNKKTTLNCSTNGTCNGYVEYSISLDSTPELPLTAKNKQDLEKYSVFDNITQMGKVLNFVTVKALKNETIKENVTLECRSDRSFSKTYYEFPKRRRVEIKLHPVVRHTTEGVKTKDENTSKEDVKTRSFTSLNESESFDGANLNDSHSSKGREEETAQTEETRARTIAETENLESGATETPFQTEQTDFNGSTSEIGLKPNTETEKYTVANVSKSGTLETEIGTDSTDKMKTNNGLTDSQKVGNLETLQSLATVENTQNPTTNTAPDQLLYAGGQLNAYSSVPTDVGGQTLEVTTSEPQFVKPDQAGTVPVTNQLYARCKDEKVKVRMQLDIADQHGRIDNVDRIIDLDLNYVYQPNKKPKSFDDDVNALIWNYFGYNIYKHIISQHLQCPEEPNNQEQHGVRMLSSDYEEYQENGGLYDANSPGPDELGRFYMGPDGRYYIIPTNPYYATPKPPSLLQRVSKRIQSALNAYN